MKVSSKMKFITSALTPNVFLLGLIVFCQRLKAVRTDASPNGTFKHPNFIVHFTGNPHPSKGLIINDVEDFLPMIEKISTEFSQISCTNKHIPVAVATHNKISSMRNASAGVYQKPLEVYLQNLPSKSKKTSGTTFVDALVELADKSNDIFPGTVKYIIGYNFSFGEFEKRWSLSTTRKRFMENSTHHKYKLGIVLPLDDCKEVILKGKSTLSYHAHLVAFVTDIVYNNMNNLTVEQSFIELTMQFELCRKIAKSLNPQVEVGFQTGISDTDPNGKQDYSTLATFWKMVNDWAIANNVKVTIFEAFDSPDRGSLRGRRGLWKLARTPRRYHIPADFIFMDKRLGTHSFSETASSTKNNLELKKDLDFKHYKFVVDFDPSEISKYDSKHYYHHDDFLPVIRTIANIFSSVYLTEYNPAVTEAVAIHNSMIIQSNEKKTNSQGLSQPLQLYVAFQLKDENNLDYALNASKIANSLFPDTVKYLVFEDYDADKLLTNVINAGESIINQTVGLAITMSLLDCLKGTSVRTRVSRLFPYVKLIYIYLGTKQEDHDVGVEETVIGLTRAFVRCKKKIERLSRKQSLKFVFGSSWADSDTHSIQNFSNLVRFWGEMNYWAKVTNTTVFMAEAFDIISDPDMYSYGWWRLADTPRIYHSIAEYVYEDKTERRSRIRNGIPYVGNKTFLDGDTAFEHECNVTNSAFSQTNFIVEFSPIMHKQHTKDGFTADQIRKIILKLFTRFSSICTEKLDETDLHNSMRHIPLEVAKFNLERGLKNESRSLYLVFMVHKKDDGDGAIQGALAMANMANSISAGSVEYLILYNNDGYLDDVKDEMKYFIKAKKMIKASRTTSYKLGYIYSILECGHGTNLKKEIIPVLKVLDLIIFYLYPEYEDYKAGVYESIRGFIKEFERCKQKISQFNSSTEVAFRTSWSDTDTYRGHSLKNFVLFWEKMNEWAVSTNTKLFILEAFDSPNSETIEDNKSGWWRLLSEETHNGSTKFIFEEKRSVLLESIGKNNLSEARPKTVLISVVTAVVVFALTAFSVFVFVYRRYKNKLTEAQQYVLTKKEETEFFQGSLRPQSPQSTDVKLGEELAAHFQKYDKEYEVEQEYFKFDETTQLGSGEFGIVCKGTVTKDEQEIDVAVKSLKKTNSSEAVKGLLAEIKVMIYLGKHENIVSMIGAHTEEIRRGRILLFTELCEKGSLENYLRELRLQINTSDATKNEKEGNVRVDQRRNDELDMLDIYQGLESQSNSITKMVTYANGPNALNQAQKFFSRWSYEIANGMEFIVSKKVVHADLATRNVLLTDNLTAKISDFGLSRRLYNYTNYVKSKSQPLPWKWMSPESLRRWEFNEKTDVWAFGITLWEIYSLGDTPYPGLSWTINFSSELERGLRPQEPEFSANSMYSVMLRCWNIDPKNRPTFLQLKEILTRQ